jgi:hypothetical protein
VAEYRQECCIFELRNDTMPPASVGSLMAGIATRAASPGCHKA